MKAAELFVRCLENEGVQYVFGIPGEENLDFLDALTRSSIQLVLTRHEQTAGFMAATYGRLTGKAGVCLSTLGPGATNLVTAAAYANLGAMPMVMITGQKPIKSSKQGQFQIVDVVDMMQPLTKFTKQISSGDMIPSSVREAFRRAQEERPGAAHLEVTGSPAVGWKPKARAGKKKVVLELGGNAACIVDAEADLADATERLITGAFYQSGQSCISVQRILVHASVYDDLRARLVAAASALKMGDPKDEATFIGPLISAAEAERLQDWIDRARASGGNLLCGGGRESAMLEATLLEEVPADQPICTEEAFGPVAVLSSFQDFGDALRQVNASAFGLQAGIFTNDLSKVLRAWDQLEVGGVVINDVPSWRVDNMPYGGVKDSGLGREGIRYAIEDMTEPRLLVMRERRTGR